MCLNWYHHIHQTRVDVYVSLSLFGVKPKSDLLQVNLQNKQLAVIIKYKFDDRSMA